MPTIICCKNHSRYQKSTKPKAQRFWVPVIITELFSNALDLCCFLSSLCFSSFLRMKKLKLSGGLVSVSKPELESKGKNESVSTFLSCTYTNSILLIPSTSTLILKHLSLFLIPWSRDNNQDPPTDGCGFLRFPTMLVYPMESSLTKCDILFHQRVFFVAICCQAFCIALCYQCACVSNLCPLVSL